MLASHAADDELVLPLPTEAAKQLLVHRGPFVHHRLNLSRQDRLEAEELSTQCILI
jgi:hypothetical protein